jgi:hypothetical protein
MGDQADYELHRAMFDPDESEHGEADLLAIIRGRGIPLTPEARKGAALEAVTEATREVVTANQGLFLAMRERQARRKEALDLGATLAEVQAAITAGQPPAWRPQ